MHNQKGFFSVPLILLVILIGVGGIFYYGVTKGNLLKTTDPNLDITKQFDEQVNQIVDTSNWNTYTNKYSNYEIKYPSNGKLMDCDGQCNFDAQLDFENLHIAFVSQGIANTTMVENPILYSFCSTTKTSNPQIKQIATIDFYMDQKVIADDNLCAEYIAKLKSVSFDTNSNSYWIIDIQTRAKNKSGQALLDQILSTFKFINPRSLTPTLTVRDMPIVLYPGKNEKIQSPLIVKGIAPAGWMFEGQLVLKLLDNDRKVIAQGKGVEEKLGSWTSGNPVSFEGKIIFEGNAESGYLVVENDNPSGLPENQKTFEIPVQF